MAKKTFDGKYVIMLDADLEVFPDEWAIRTVDNSLQDAMRRRQFTAKLLLVSRQDYEARLLRNKQLYDSRGNREPGGVYLMTAVTE